MNGQARFMFTQIKQLFAHRPFLRRLVLFLLLLMALPYAIAPAYRFFWPVSTQMLWKRLTFQPYERRWMPLREMAPGLVVAVIAAEDGRFCSHYGVDFSALAEAVSDALEDERPRGASTITMQVARNLFLWQGRSYLRKALEIPLALWIDLVLPKRRILEIYLNVAEWGDPIFGANAAAQRYFGKSARALTVREAALLATSLPNPRRRNASAPDPRHARAAATVLARVAREKIDLACISS